MIPKNIKKSYLAPLDGLGNKIYKDLRIAEEDWIQQTGYTYYEVGKRSYLIIATDTKLPPTKHYDQLREEFRNYLQEKIEESKDTDDELPHTLGKRSTALPVWILPDRKITIDQTPDKKELEPAISITLRQQIAFRSGLINLDELRNILRKMEDKCKKSIEGAEKRKNKKRMEKAILRKNEIDNMSEEIENLAKEYGQKITARLHSGASTRFRIKTKSHAWTATIANVGIVYGNKKTEIIWENSQKRTRDNQLKPIATVGSFVLYENENIQST